MAKKKDNENSIEKTYKTTYTYTCPVRGLVTQEITVNRYSPQSAPESKLVDDEVSELLRSVAGDDDLEELGFHEEKF